MRVAILHDWLVTWRGGELCLEEIASLFEDVEIFTMFQDVKLTDEKLKNYKIHSSLLGRSEFLVKRHRLFIPFVPLFIWFMSFQLKRRQNKCPFDLVLSISHCGVKNVKVPKGLKHICYCLTPVRYVWDQFDNYVSRLWLRKFLSLPRYLYSLWDVHGTHGVTIFASISEFVVGRVNRLYGRNSMLIYPPVRIDSDPLKEEVSQRSFFLVVNALVPYKNTELAIKACNELGLPLKVVGTGPELDYLKEIAGRSVEFLGNVSDQKLKELYSRARALIFCAEEDFGIVPLEANSFGTPVIFYGKGGLVETQIEGEPWTGVSFGALDVQSLKESIIRFMKMENLKDIKFCKRNANRFSVPIFHENILKLVESYVGPY